MATPCVAGRQRVSSQFARVNSACTQDRTASVPFVRPTLCAGARLRNKCNSPVRNQKYSEAVETGSIRFGIAKKFTTGTVSREVLYEQPTTDYDPTGRDKPVPSYGHATTCTDRSHQGYGPPCPQERATHRTQGEIRDRTVDNITGSLASTS